MSLVRLDRFLANAGAGSRSDVRKIIKEGRVEVGGKKILDPGSKVDPDADTVTVGGRRIGPAHPAWIMLNKPAGVVSATRDNRDATVLDLLPEELRGGLFPVGRLDRDTTGLLLLTDDGQTAHRLLSPRRHVDKTYQVTLALPVAPETKELFAGGVDIGDGKKTLPAVLSDINGNTCRVILREGRYHQVKRMFEAAGNRVTALSRLSMGGLWLDDDLAPGAFRKLRSDEIALLAKAAGADMDMEITETADEIDVEE